MADSINQLSLRKVVKSDEKRLLDWTNDPVVRNSSFNKSTITADEHKIWFNNKIKDLNVLMWVFKVDVTPAGLVRLEKENDEVILNYQIAAEFRGQGLASKMLRLALKEVEKHWPGIKVLAYTIPENIASIKSLVKAGFILVSTSTERNCYVFHKM